MTRLAPLFLFCGVLLPAVPTRGADPADYDDPVITPDEKAHWSFKPPMRPAVPSVKTAAWVKNPIDAFVLAKLEAAGLSPSPEADKLALIRRVALDLTGLPPTPEEVDAFLKDSRPDAYERLVDRLLASPHFGERWATHWLDVVRFAESNGYEADGERSHAWRYRDYVVRSFNADKPYDQYLTEQIAGDELAAGKEPRECADLWAATGLHRCGQVHMVGGNLEQDVVRQEVLTEMVNGLGSAVLGLTVGCARCHDHKFDPLSQGDYYRLQAFFASTKYVDVDLATPAEKEARKKLADELNAKVAPLKQQVAKMDVPVREKLAKAKREALEPKYKEALAVAVDKRTVEQQKLAKDAQPLLTVRWDEILGAMPPMDRAKRAALRDQQHALEAKMPPPTPAAWAIQSGDPAKTFVFKRGNPKQKLASVGPAFPRVLVSAAVEPKSRTELAKWITRPDHPLTARVIVNRLWQHHFGKGIVTTPNDFGVRGTKPTHPELLDWLASEMVKPGKPTDNRPWALKRIHRLMALSSTYRQASTTPASPAAAKVDPENKLLWRMNRHRLEAEAIRDSILTASGSLNRQVGGPSVKVPLEPEVYDLIFTEGEPDGLWPVTPDAAQHVRRSIYLFNKRNVRLPLFEAFDQPDTLNSCADRPVSTFAPQALILMNGPFVQEQGKALAAKLVRDVGTDSVKQIDALYRRALSRSPTDPEMRLATTFLKEQGDSIRDRIKARLPIGLPATELPAGADPAEVRALADLCVVVFNSNEFVYAP
jgi:hypothetical protein